MPGSPCHHRGGRPPAGGAPRRLAQPPSPVPADLEKRTLINLYNQCPTWVANAHAALDAAVLAAYGWPGDLADSDILERQLGLTLNTGR